jgi:nitric oxide reductase subunit C
MNLSKWFFVGCVLLALTCVGALTGTAFSTYATSVDEQVALGHAVWVANGCENCHSVLGQGGSFAPDLTHIVGMRGADYLHEFFVNPAAFHPNQRIMPRFNITRNEVNGVIAYLQAAENSTAAQIPPVQVAGMGGLSMASAPVNVVAMSDEDPQIASGRAVYSTRCASCHSLAENVIVIGPSFWNIANVAGERVAGQSAETYLRNSIVYPSDFIVDGYQDVMQKNLGEVLTVDDIEHVVAYLLTLKEDGS